MQQRSALFDRARFRVVVRVAFVVALLAVLVRHHAALAAGIRAMADAALVGVLVTAALVGTTYVFAAISLAAASGRPLPLGRTALTQLSAVCANRVTPAGLGAMGVNLRYLVESGATRAEALAAIGLSGVVTTVVRLTTAIIVVVVVGHAGLSTVVDPAPVHLVLVGGAVVAGGAVAMRRRRDLLDAVRGGWSSVRGVRRSPSRVVGLLVGSCGSTAGHALSFVAAAHACGVRLPIAALLIVFMGGSAVGAAAPAAAGLGSVEAALVAGLSGFGADAAPAMAAALTFRLVTYWLPIGPSLVALWLTRRYPPVPGLKPDPASPVDVLPTPVPALALALVPVPVPVNVWIRPRPAGATAYRYGVSV